MSTVYEPVSRALVQVFAAASNMREVASRKLQIEPILRQIARPEDRWYLSEIMDEIEEACGSLPELDRIREKLRVWHVKTWPGIKWPEEAL